MKTKIIIIISIVIGLSLTIAGIIFLNNSYRISTDTAELDRAIFEYDDLKISENLSAEDLSMIQEIFNNKKLYKD